MSLPLEWSPDQTDLLSQALDLQIIRLGDRVPYWISTYRLESTLMMCGHAAGVAAALAARTGGTVQDVDVTDLRRRLVGQGQVVDFVPGQPKRFSGDPRWPEF
mgnify:CR=1 FL=1